MIIKDLFLKPIDRYIDGVIKAYQQRVNFSHLPTGVF